MNCFSVIYLCGILLPFVSGRHVQFFRRDYTYIEKYDAYYKVNSNLNGISFNDAVTACDREGATLFYPKVNDEQTIVKNLFKEKHLATNNTDIFVGLHDKFNVGQFISVEGDPVTSPLVVISESTYNYSSEGKCLLMQIETEYYKYSNCTPDQSNTTIPYICKKVDSGFCPTIDESYKYVKSSKKCYKIHNRGETWEKALKTCYLEGASLAVAENKAEADAIYGLLKLYKTYQIGFRKISSPDIYFTVTGQNIDNIYQEKLNWDTSKECGAVYVGHLQLITVTTPCDYQLPYICEMDMKEIQQ